MNREDFPMLKQNLIYFDNGATTFKPQSVIDSITSYYTMYTSNAHRGDYNISLIVDRKYEEVRSKVKNFINCCRKEEIIFTKGTTESLNMVVFGFLKQKLKKGDEILLTKVEHASNILPYFNLSKQLGIKIKYIPLNDDLTVSL